MPNYLPQFFGAAGRSFEDEERKRRSDQLKRYIEAGRRGGVIDRGPSATEMLQRRDLSVMNMQQRQPEGVVEKYVKASQQPVETDPLARDRTQILRDYSQYSNVPGMKETLESISKGEEFDPNETRFNLSLGALREQEIENLAAQESKAIGESRKEAAKMGEEAAAEVTYGLHTYKNVSEFTKRELNPLLSKRTKLEGKDGMGFVPESLQNKIDRVMDRAYGADTPTRRFINSIKTNPERMRLMVEGGLSEDKLQQLRDMGVDIEVVIDLINQMYSE